MMGSRATSMLVVRPWDSAMSSGSPAILGRSPPLLIRARPGVQRCFSTSTIPQCQGTGFLRIRWQGGLGKVGKGFKPWAALCTFPQQLQAFPPALGWGSRLFLFLRPQDTVTFDFCLINIQPTDTVFKEVLILSGHQTQERQSHEEPAPQ